MSNIDLETLRATIPNKFRATVTQDTVDLINNLSDDPDYAEILRDNFISYSQVLQEPQMSVKNYIDAIKYCSYKMMGMSNVDSWIKAFPDRYTKLVAKGVDRNGLSSHVTSFHKGKIVNLILERAMVPTWLLNQDLFQKALNVQATIMNDEDVSPMHRVAAANSLLTHLKRPEAAGPTVNIDMRESSGLKDLKETLNQLAKTQLDLIDRGVTARSLAEQKIVQGEVIDG